MEAMKKMEAVFGDPTVGLKRSIARNDPLSGGASCSLAEG